MITLEGARNTPHPGPVFRAIADSFVQSLKMEAFSMPALAHCEAAMREDAALREA